MPVLKGIISDVQQHDLETSLGTIPGAVARASVDALNATMTTVRKELVGQLATAHKINQASVRRHVPLFKASESNPAAAALFKGGARGFNLASFDDTEETGTGLSSPFGDVPAGFFMPAAAPLRAGFAPAQRGRELAVKRDGPKRAMTKGRYAGALLRRGPRKGQPLLRQPVAAQRGPTVSGLLQQTPGALEAVARRVPEVLATRLAQQTERFLVRSGRTQAGGA